ncbi:MAG: phospholipase D-like domain-containing protein [Limisphaerales bacterium]
MKRALRSLGLVATLLALLLSTPNLSAAAGPLLLRRTTSAAQLKELGSRNPPQAWVKGHSVRLYYPHSGKLAVFKAEWKQPPLLGRTYTATLAELRFDATPPQLPSPRGPWIEAVVLPLELWPELARASASHLVGAEPLNGTRFQLLNLEGVLYRNTSGGVNETSIESAPANITITRAANAEEFAFALTRAVRDRFAPAHPGRYLFLLRTTLQPDQPDFILVDVRQRLCVYLGAPMPADDPRGGASLIPSPRLAASFFLESHGVALVKNPVSAAARLLNLGFYLVSRAVPPRVLKTRPKPPPPVTGARGMDLESWERHLDRVTRAPRSRGTLRLLIDGPEFFPEFEERLRGARERIDLRVCIFDRDDVAVGIADLLRERSREINVRVLIDRLSSQNSAAIPPTTSMREGFVAPASIGRYLEKDSRVRVRPFLNPWFSSEHSKVFLIDHDTAYLGGMNLGREYRYEWHDLMVELRGPVVAQLDRGFSLAWAHAGALGDLAYLSRAVLPGPRRAPSPEPTNAISLRILETRTFRPEFRIAVLGALERARNHAFLENAYLFDRSVIRALLRARQRGVDVRVILPNRSDVLGGDSSNFVVANHLISGGVRTYLHPGMTHVKALLISTAGPAWDRPISTTSACA